MQLFNRGAVIHVGFEKGTGVQYFQPGENLIALVQVRPENTITCRDVEVGVGWHTEGKGDRDSQTIYAEPLGVTEILPGSPLSYEFHYQLPDSPWSYQGELIRLVWAVRVKIDIAMMPDINHTEPFVLQP